MSRIWTAIYLVQNEWSFGNPLGTMAKPCDGETDARGGKADAVSTPEDVTHFFLCLFDFFLVTMSSSIGTWSDELLPMSSSLSAIGLSLSAIGSL